MDFLNPGYLGGAADFRRASRRPSNATTTRPSSEQLRGLVRPFILRRLKTDPNVIADLPEKVEIARVLPPHQRAGLALRETASSACSARSIRSRGHPTPRPRPQRAHQAQADLQPPLPVPQGPRRGRGRARDITQGPPTPRARASASASSKCSTKSRRTDQALIFTQFRQMGTCSRHAPPRPSTRGPLPPRRHTQKQRDSNMIETLPEGRRHGPHPHPQPQGRRRRPQPHRRHPRLPLRPLVEPRRREPGHRPRLPHRPDQAHRQVHKFVVRGTLEERIDQMIEQQDRARRETIIGSGETLAHRTVDRQARRTPFITARAIRRAPTPAERRPKES
jgi:hypothetical protein